MRPSDRWHPFTPAVVAIAIGAMALIAPPPHGTAVAYGLAITAALAAGTPRSVGVAAFICAPMWVLLFVMHGVLGEGDRTAWLGMSLSTDGLDWALRQGLRLGALITASLAWAELFDAHRFLQAAIAAGWKFHHAFLVVATMDAAERLGQHARRLREAQRTRGLRLSGSLVTRARAVPALVLPLMLSSLTDADERALALETRGFTLRTKRHALRAPPTHARDRVVRWLAVAGMLAAAAWRLA